MISPVARLGVAAALLALGVPALAQDDATRCEPADLAALSGWDGVWLAEGQETDISGRDAPRRTRFFGLDAPWNDVGWARMRSAVSILTSASFAQSGFGFPAMMDNFSELSFFVGLRQTVILNAYRETRIIHTDGRDHIPDDEAFPSTWGDSIGCWEGDTLTIDTVNVHFDPVFNPVTAPLSDQAHFSERLRLVAPGRIEMRMTITDPQLLTEPWIVETAYDRYETADRLLVDGTINDRSVVGGDSPTIAGAESDESGLPQVASSVQLSSEQMDRLTGRYRFEGAGEGGELVVERRDARLFIKLPDGRDQFMPVFPDTPLRMTALFGQVLTFDSGQEGQAGEVTVQQVDGTRTSATRIAETS